MRHIILLVALFSALNTFAQAGSGADAPFTESQIAKKTLSGVIAGSLIVPNNAAGKIPVVLIIGDSGPTDRDGNNAKTGTSANTYKLLAEGLAKSGVASLRYDKRMVGRSVSSTKESQLRIDDYGDDAVELLKMLEEDTRFSKIIVFGHGEGALVGMIASTDEPIKGYISAEGAGEQADKILLDQMKEKPQYQQDEFKTILDSLRKGKTYDKVDLALYYIARPSIQPFLMSWCRCVPLRGIKKVKAPVMILQGSTDLTMPVSNAELLKKSRADAELVIVKNMNHVLKEAPADLEQNMATYSNPDLPLKAEVIPAIVAFVNKLK